MAKKYIITVALLIIVNFIAVQFPHTKKADFDGWGYYYSEVFVVKEVDHESGITTLESLNEIGLGRQIQTDFICDFVCGEVYSLIMYINGTSIADDDIVVKASWIASSPVVEYIKEGW